MLVARARRSAYAGPTRPEALFDEIYARQARDLPDSVTQALAALSLARDARGHLSRKRSAAWPPLSCENGTGDEPTVSTNEYLETAGRLAE